MTLMLSQTTAWLWAARKRNDARAFAKDWRNSAMYSFSQKECSSLEQFLINKNRGPDWDIENHFYLNAEKQVKDDVKMVWNCCHYLNFILFGNIWEGKFLEYFRMQEIKYKSSCILFCFQRTLNFDPEVWSLNFHFAKKYQCSFKNVLMTSNFYSEKEHKFNKVVYCSTLKELFNHTSSYYYNFLGMALVFYVITQSILVSFLLL